MIAAAMSAPPISPKRLNDRAGLMAAVARVTDSVVVLKSRGLASSSMVANGIAGALFSGGNMSADTANDPAIGVGSSPLAIAMGGAERRALSKMAVLACLRSTLRDGLAETEPNFFSIPGSVFAKVESNAFDISWAD